MLENIGENSDALFCKTNLTACCRTSWYWRYEVCLQSHMCSVITLFFGCLFFGAVLHPYRHSTHLVWSTHSAHICLGSRISFGSNVGPLRSSCCIESAIICHQQRCYQYCILNCSQAFPCAMKLYFVGMKGRSCEQGYRDQYKRTAYKWLSLHDVLIRVFLYLWLFSAMCRSIARMKGQTQR